ncbi:MAG: flagellar basal body P-ring protein FlgI [Planctomycetota bacterium]|jgi:flagellar basal body P-ring protein FlgI
MGQSNIKISLYILILPVLVAAMFGCGQEQAQIPGPSPLVLDGTIGSMAELYEFGEIPVKGWGIVAGLAGTGSSECPPVLRDVLIKYIQQQVSGESRIDPGGFIDSLDTAVVEIRGVIPAIASKGQNFDLHVTAFSSTQTTSLAGGILYPAELKEVSRLQRFDQYSKTLAKAQGPIFINKLDTDSSSELAGHVLGGGTVGDNVRISLILPEPDYRIASIMRNRLNGRFGPGTARAVSASEIQLTIPARFKDNKNTFLVMATSMYLTDDKQSQQNRIEMLVSKLSRGEDVASSQIALMAIGKAALDELAPLLDSPDQNVRFHAAACMLNIGHDRSLPVLREIVKNPESPYRIEAVRVIGTSAKRNDAIPLLDRLLADRDFDVRFAAYEQLRRLGDVSVSQIFVGGDFFVDSVMTPGEKTIYVSRSGGARVVLFGSPIYCKDNIFIESEERKITINAGAGDKYISVMRKHPKSSRLFGPLRSSFKLADLIRTLGQKMPSEDKSLMLPGLGAGYSQITVLLKKMVENGAVEAQFRAGPMAQTNTGENKAQ